MRALLDHVPLHERLIVIEQPAELKIAHPNAVRWKAVDAIPREVAVTPSQLLAAALRHRPDRIIMGEIRDACGYDLLQAMNTGHGGTLSTIHAKSAQNALNRLSDLALSARPNLNHSFVVRRLRKLSTSFCTAEGQPGVLPWRVAHNATEGLTEGALGFVARRLRDGARPSPEFFRRSAARKHAPARKVFHRRGTNDLAKRSAKTERDIPTRSANKCSVQGYPGSLCMLVMAILICLSDSAESQPRPAVVASARYSRSAWISIM